MVHGRLQNGGDRRAVVRTEGTDRLHAGSAGVAGPLQPGSESDQRKCAGEAGPVVSRAAAKDWRSHLIGTGQARLAGVCRRYSVQGIVRLTAVAYVGGACVRELAT